MREESRTKKKFTLWNKRINRSLCMVGKGRRDKDNPIAIEQFRHKPYGGMHESI